MSESIAQLRALSDEDVMTLHDTAAVHTSVGVGFYLDELRRREQARAIQSSHRLAVASFVLSGVNALVAVVAVVIALKS